MRSPPSEREALARLLLESITPGKLSDEELRRELISRLERLKSGEQFVVGHGGTG